MAIGKRKNEHNLKTLKKYVNLSRNHNKENQESNKKVKIDFLKMAEEQVRDSRFPASVKASFQLGSEVFLVDSKPGMLSHQLMALKEESMGILKEYITKHNVPNDVPDELIEASPEEGEEEEEEEEGIKVKNPRKKSKKKK
ncbi:hypothetical protein HPP92_022446 [Vanilla planifolia]|uniref:Uncharacterized protein n=1 Tax=Vanilla planifolia TaxID=51239 RepID=A0A835PY98_VANPL|nr:hypothetical protein HPP92_022749 [Vanilla planifolia]KAG0459318.1 hypothetical protein HPP92_022446 [Vanilla planifolia]